MLARRPLSTDMQKRRFRAQRSRHSGNGIATSVPRRRDETPRLSSLARITVGSMRRYLFMSEIDDPDAFADTTVVNIDDIASRKV